MLLIMLPMAGNGRAAEQLTAGHIVDHMIGVALDLCVLLKLEILETDDKFYMDMQVGNLHRQSCAALAM